MSQPIVVDLAATRAALPFPDLIAALREAFIAGAEVPLRHRHAIDVPGASEATLLLMPAWRAGAVGVKIVSVYPSNGARGLNAVHSTYLLSEGDTGRPLALIDGNEITGRRTAAASALAGDHLARRDASSLLIVGAGHIAGLMAQAWAAVRPIRRVQVWNRNTAKAETLAADLRAEGFDATATPGLEAAARQADIISCATLSATPLILGEWLKPDAHLDLIGGYRPDMRETDDTAIRRARIWIDTPAALAEAGDLTQPIESGVLDKGTLAGDLAGLCRGRVAGRLIDGEITLFKSVGSAIEDLAAASLVWKTVRQEG